MPSPPRVAVALIVALSTLAASTSFFANATSTSAFSGIFCVWMVNVGLPVVGSSARFTPVNAGVSTSTVLLPRFQSPVDRYQPGLPSSLVFNSILLGSMEIFGNFPSPNAGKEEFLFHTPPIAPVVTETVTSSTSLLCSTLSTLIVLNETWPLDDLSSIVTQSLDTDLIASAPFRVIGKTPVNFVAPVVYVLSRVVVN